MKQFNRFIEWLFRIPPEKPDCVFTVGSCDICHGAVFTHDKQAHFEWHSRSAV